MAADQLNKRSKVSNVICHTSWEQRKAKKKKLSHYDSNMRSNISLEWDDKKENVVPKKEQISIARRELTPFLPLVSQCQNVLGDVFAAPPELFERENLVDLLSYEVWQTHLSVQEKEFLTQFLPEGLEPYKVVHELLAENNLYFGNPFPKWGASVCSGDCHPDAVLRKEQCNKANKIAYYSELNQYHTKMIGSLQFWKGRWASCVNPEQDFMQKILRSRKDFHRSGSSHVNGILCGPEENLGATSDSCSWDADDKSYSSDSPNITMLHGETLRVSRMDLEDKYDDSSGGWRSVARPSKGDKLYKRNIACGDGAKYMSYIKVSKEQHERVKSSMKYSSASIQPRSLNHVLGSLASFCVQPYEVFEEEERQRLHEHWSYLAKQDLPAGFENWKSWRSAKWQLTKSLRKELEDKQKSNDVLVSDLCNEENGKFGTSLLHGTYIATKDEVKEQALCRLQQHDAETSGQVLTLPEDNLEQNADSIFHSEAENQTEHTVGSTQNLHLHQIAIPMPIDSDTFPSNLGGYTTHVNHSLIGEQYPLSSVGSEMWPQSSLLEWQKDSLRSFLPRRSDGGDSFFNPYANELVVHSLFKDPGSCYYPNEQKQSRQGFHPSGSSDAMLNMAFFKHHNVEENMYARQEQFLPVQDWAGNGNMAMAASSHQNWDIGNAGQVADESLFSVLSQCKGGNSVPPRMLNYINGNEGWINFPRQNAANDKDLGL